MATTTSITRKTFLPYGRQCITAEDIAAVTSVLQSDWLTQGPAIAAFEKALAGRIGARHVVSCSNGTAALHLCMLALGLGPGDRVLTTPITFLADANAARYVGADVVFADIDSTTGLVDPESIERQLRLDTAHTIKAIIPVDFAGQPADLPRIEEIARAHGAVVIDDACHALGASYHDSGHPLLLGGGEHSALTVFSFHPVKHVAMGEGGAVATNDDRLADRVRLLRNHGMQKDEWVYPELALAPDNRPNPWYYELQELGYNYRLTDIQAALGLSQLSRLDHVLARRRYLADRYHSLLSERFDPDEVQPLKIREGIEHAWHLYVVSVNFARFNLSRSEVMNRLRLANIGTQVHYIPIPLQPYYRNLYGLTSGQFSEAEAYYERALSLPMYPELTDDALSYIVDTLSGILRERT